ncbi:MAG: M23 family metallopeptidase, partial [Opitutae bacterium]|nr:M23 family metallopeptidase [Opitutae bacterium]
YKFHEGIDIKSQRRDRYNRPLDKVIAIMPGRVAYINKVGGKSSYGIYVILEHLKQKPKVYSLYAHLRSVESGISIGQNLAIGHVIGLMGHTASTGIPVSRAHLHFEIGLRLTDNFQNWYNQQKFKTKNEHGIWNGMNMVGLDTLDFFRKVADGRVSSIEDYFRTIPEAFRLRVRSSKTPNLMRRYPGLLTSKIPPDVTGWDITYSWYGLPTSITPQRLSQNDTGPKIQVLKLNKTLLTLKKCRSTLLINDAGVRIGSILKLYLGLIFEV